jgi:hypothetical protein
MPTGDLRKLSRRELVERATGLGVDRAATMTKTELVEAIRRVEEPNTGRTPRTWFGRARDLVARVVEQGLHLPDAAKVLRGAADKTPAGPPPLPTVTLAEIYAAQGYNKRALGVVDAVLERVPDHAEALALRKRLLGAVDGGVSSEEAKDAPPAEPAPAEPAPAEPAPAEPAPAEPAPAEPAPAEPAPAEPAPAEPAPAAAEPAPAEPATAEPATAEPATAAEPATTAPSAEPGGAAGSLPRWDDVVALATDPRTVYVYWEVRAVSFARARWKAPAGQLVLRVLSLVPGFGDAARRDIPIDELVGDTFVTGLSSGSEVRVAIGWASDDDFAALAVAPELSMPRDYNAPVLATRRVGVAEAAEMRAAHRAQQQGSPNLSSPSEAHDLPSLVDVAGRRLEDYVAGQPTSVVHLTEGTRRVTTVLQLGGASDLVTKHGDASWFSRIRRGGAGGASDLVAQK